MNALIALAILLSVFIPVMFLVNRKLDDRKKELMQKIGKLDESALENSKALASLLNTIKNRRL